MEKAKRGKNMETANQQELSWKVKSIWWECVAKVRHWCVANFVCGVILYVWMIVKGYLYTYIVKDDMYHFLVYVIPAMLIISAICFGITYIGDDSIKIDMVGCVFAINLCVSAVSYLVVQWRIGGHLSEYEDYARGTLAVWSVVHLVTIIGIVYSKSMLKKMEKYSES